MVVLRNLLFEDNSVQWGWSEPAAALSVRYSSSVLLEESSFIDNNPSQLNNPSVVSVTNSSNLIVITIKFDEFVTETTDGLLSWEGLLSINEDSSNKTLELYLTESAAAGSLHPH